MADAHHPLGGLVVAQQEHERRTRAVGALHLAFHAASAEGAFGANPPCAQFGSEFEYLGLRGVAECDDVDLWFLVLSRGLFSRQLQETLHADREADTRRGRAAQLLHEAVVAPPAAHRVLRSEALARHLEDGEAVVVEAADEPRVDLIRDARALDEPAYALQMRPAVIVPEFIYPRRARDDLLVVRVLAVQKAKRVALDPFGDFSAQVLRFRSEIFLESGGVGRAAFRIAQVVDLERQALDAHFIEKFHEHHDEFGVDRRVHGAEDLRVYLVELAQAARLGTLVAEHGADAEELRDARAVVEAVLHVGSADRGGRLGAQRDGIAPLVFEGVHLLGDDVGLLADSAREEFGALEGGHSYLPVAVARENLPRQLFGSLPPRRFFGQDVFHAAHRRESGPRHHYPPKAASNRRGRATPEGSCTASLMYGLMSVGSGFTSSTNAPPREAVMGIEAAGCTAADVPATIR